MMLTVWGRADSSAVARVMWTIGELGLEHVRHDVGGPFGGLETAGYRAKNPSGRIPTLELADGTALWESNAIIRYLCAEHDLGGTMPADPKMRAKAEAVMDWSSTFGGVVGRIRAAYKAEGASSASCAPAVAAAVPTLAVLESLLGNGDFVLGQSLSIADLSLGVIGLRLARCPTEIGLPEMPHFERWFHGLTQRPAYRSHVIEMVSSGTQIFG
jgi:glutathione S-transferase